MTIRRILLYVAAVVLLTAPAVTVQAQTAQEIAVQNQCATLKTALDQQRRRDLVARINRGRAYQNLSDMMQALTNRARISQMNAQPFEQQLETLNASIETFRSSYTSYDDALAALLRIDCQNQPAQFLTQLIKTRQLRLAVGEQVATIEGALGRYRQIITNLQVELERIRNAVLGENL